MDELLAIVRFRNDLDLVAVAIQQLREVGGMVGHASPTRERRVLVEMSTTMCLRSIFGRAKRYERRKTTKAAGVSTQRGIAPVKSSDTICNERTKRRGRYSSYSLSGTLAMGSTS